MEDFPVALLFLIFYLIAVSSSQKNKKRKPSSRSRRQATRRDIRKALRDQPTQAGMDEAPVQAAAQQPEAQKACDTRQMHLHEVGQNVFSAAVEGEDPCHVGGHDLLEEEHMAAEQTSESDTFAQDVLRGVIMSEILTRPCERRVMQRKGFR